MSTRFEWLAAKDVAIVYDRESEILGWSDEDRAKGEDRMVLAFWYDECFIITGDRDELMTFGDRIRATVEYSGDRADAEEEMAKEPEVNESAAEEPAAEEVSGEVTASQGEAG